MAVTDRPWNGAASRFEDDEYRRSAILDRADCSASARDLSVKERYALPIREPDGTLNANALGAAAAALAGARTRLKACTAAKSKAAARLLRAYGEAEMEPPASLKSRAS